MYDVLGDTVLIPKNYYEDLSECGRLALLKGLLERGYKKIFTRGRFSNSFRTLSLDWVSPYQEPPFSTKFLTRENNYLFYGDLREAYYSPRYHKQRSEVVSLLRDHSGEALTLIGSGISPYTVYLNRYFRILEIEPNDRAYRYGRINLTMNGCTSEGRKTRYEGDPSQVVLSMVPRVDPSLHKTYNFRRTCVFYVLMEDSRVPLYSEQLKVFYSSSVTSRLVRKYTKSLNIYRFVLER